MEVFFMLVCFGLFNVKEIFRCCEFDVVFSEVVLVVKGRSCG